MGTSTDTNNELASGTVQIVSIGGYSRELNGEMSNGTIFLEKYILFPSNRAYMLSFTSLNSYPQSTGINTGGGEAAL